MRVEPAMGEAGVLHQIGDADAVRALLAKPHRGLLHDPSVGFLLVFLRIAHWRPIGCLKSYNNGSRQKKMHLFANGRRSGPRVRSATLDKPMIWLGIAAETAP